MARTLLLFLFFLFINFSFCQYTDVINSNNPGKSMGAYSVGRRVVQAESEFFYDRESHPGMELEQSNYGLNYEIRYGALFERLEFILDGTVLYDKKTLNKSFGGEVSSFGFYQNTLGAKFLVFEPAFFSEGPNVRSWRKNATFQWRKLIPAISVYGGATFFEKNRFLYETLSFEELFVNPKAVISLQSHPARDAVLVINLIGNKLLSTNKQYGYIVSLTHNLYKARWSIFLENEGVSTNYYNDSIIRSGASCLITPELMLNAWAGLSLKTTPSRYSFAVGVSYRVFNQHHKIEYQEKMKARKKEAAEDAKIFNFKDN